MNLIKFPMRLALRAMNKALEPLGYRVARIPYFAVELERVLKAKPKLKFVQVGANDGVRFDGLFFAMTANRCPGLVIEPLPDYFARLSMNYRNFPEVTAVNLALHPTQQEARIYRVDPAKIADLPEWAEGIASFVPGHCEKLGIPRDAVVTEAVKCARLMDVLSDHEMLDADLLQIDTEGFDAEIIKMIDFSRFSPALIKFELVHLPQGERDSVRDLLSRANYRVVPDGNDFVAYRRAG